MTGPAGRARSDADAEAHVRAVVRRSGTSFFHGMRILSHRRRLAMYALYAFGREVDDVADEDAAPVDKVAALDAWREEVAALYAGRPTRPTTIALADPVRRFGLPKAELLGLIHGMEMDATEAMRAPDEEQLALYCRRVAGTVGVLSIHVFGATDPAATTFALALADGLQLTNILRDIDEDAARGRLYLPAELLATHGLDPDAPVDRLVADPAVDRVCHELARRARERFAAADQALAATKARAMRPALLMMGAYERVLDELERVGWRPPRPPLRLSSRAKLWAGLKRGVWPRPRRPRAG